MRWILSELNPPPSCLLWDVDGTMIDTTNLIVASLDHAYKTYFDCTLPTSELRALIGLPLKTQVRIFGEPENFRTDAETVMAACIEYYETHRNQERVLNKVTQLLREGKERGIPTGLVTSKNREELHNTLPRLEIAAYIDSAVTADDVVRPKPAPDGILLALDQLNVMEERRPFAVYIGDTVHDMQAARDAGVIGIAVTWGAAMRSQLESEHPFCICETPESLKSLLF